MYRFKQDQNIEDSGSSEIRDRTKITWHKLSAKVPKRLDILPTERQVIFEPTLRAANAIQLKPELPGPSHRRLVCVICGGTLLIPAGSCHVCQNCGTSQGCS